MANLGAILSDGQQGLANSFKVQLDMINGRRASASNRDGVIMQLRDRGVPHEFINAHLPQSEDSTTLVAGAEKAITGYRNALVSDLKSKGVADELVNAHVPADLTQSSDFAAGASAALNRHQQIVGAGSDAAAANAASGAFLKMPGAAA